MCAPAENERQTSAASDSNFKEASMSIVLQQGCYLVLAGTTQRYIISNVQDVFIGTSSSSTNPLSRGNFAESRKCITAKDAPTQSMMWMKANTQYISTDGSLSFSVPGSAATVSTLTLA